MEWSRCALKNALEWLEKYPEDEQLCRVRDGGMCWSGLEPWTPASPSFRKTKCFWGGTTDSSRALGISSLRTVRLGQGDDALGKSTVCSYRGPGSGLSTPCGSSQASLSPVLSGPHSGFHRHCVYMVHRKTCRQKIHIYKIRLNHALKVKLWDKYSTK